MQLTMRTGSKHHASVIKTTKIPLVLVIVLLLLTDGNTFNGDLTDSLYHDVVINLQENTGLNFTNNNADFNTPAFLRVEQCCPTTSVSSMTFNFTGNTLNGNLAGINFDLKEKPVPVTFNLHDNII
jgi:hypothetical protein